MKAIVKIFKRKTVKKDKKTFAAKVQKIGRENSVDYRKLERTFESSSNHGKNGKKEEMKVAIKKAIAVQKKRGFKLLEQSKAKLKQERRVV